MPTNYAMEDMPIWEIGTFMLQAFDFINLKN